MTLPSSHPFARLSKPNSPNAAPPAVAAAPSAQPPAAPSAANTDLEQAPGVTGEQPANRQVVADAVHSEGSTQIRQHTADNVLPLAQVDLMAVGQAVATATATATATAAAAVAAPAATLSSADRAALFTAPAATPPLPAVADDNWPKIGVVTAHTNAMASKILRGTCGKVDGQAFSIDPIYKQVCYFFTLMDSGQLPVPGLQTPDVVGTKFKTIGMPTQGLLDQLRTNLIANQAARWDAMYEEFAPLLGMGGDLARNMIDNERRTVAAGCARVVSESELQWFCVPATWSAFVGESLASERTAEGITTAGAMLSHANVVPLSIIPLGSSAVADLVPANLAEVALDAETLAHDGLIQLEVAGFVRVLATDVESAKLLAPAVITLAAELGETPPVIAESILDRQLDPATEQYRGETY